MTPLPAYMTPLPAYLGFHSRPGVSLPPDCVTPEMNDRMGRLPDEQQQQRYRDEIIREKCVVIDADPSQLGLDEGKYYAIGLQTAYKTPLREIGPDIRPMMFTLNMLNNVLRGIPIHKIRSMRNRTAIVFRRSGLNETILSSPSRVLEYVEQHDPSNLQAWRNFYEKESFAFGQEVETRGATDRNYTSPILQSRVLSRESQQLLLQYYRIAVPHSLLSRLMPRMCTDIRDKIERGENPIAVAAFAHMRLVDLHPFEDQNGRTARLVMQVALHQFGLPPVYFYSEKEYLRAVEKALDKSLEDPQYGTFTKYLSKKVFFFQQLIALAKELSPNGAEQQRIIAEAGFLTCEGFVESARKLHEFLEQRR